MAGEKPKNKAKPKRISRSRRILLAAVIIIAATGLLYVIYLVTPTRLQLNNVQAVTISDGAWALSGEVDSTYNLTMSEGSLMGSATFSVTTFVVDGHPSKSHTDTISIPPEVVSEFLNKLEEAQLELGEYSPVEVYDYFPSVVMSFEMTTGIVEIFNMSPNRMNTPWGANIQGQAYIINSGIPAQALAMLEPYLKGEILDELMADVRASD